MLKDKRVHKARILVRTLLGTEFDVFEATEPMQNLIVIDQEGNLILSAPDMASFTEKVIEFMNTGNCIRDTPGGFTDV